MNKKKRFLSSFRVWLLMIAILLQSCALALTGAAAEIDLSELFKKQPEVEDSKKPFEKDEIISQLKKELLNSINRDLIRKVEEDRLTGPVDVILAFSEDSLIGAYAKDTAGMTYPEYRDTLRAADLKKRLNANQNSVLKDLESGGLITDVKYHYYHMFDGAYVSTTYEQLDAICKTEGVERVLIANTYRPADAVENKVNTYETGIFNSSDVSYTGKGTIVAILDTGCDYTHTAFTTHEVANPLYDRDDIEALLDQTVAYELSEGSLEAREVYYGNITGNKIAFGYDYADQDPDVMPFSSEHGTHVAGIIGGKDSTITGVAIDTQLAIMKVFSDYRDGAKDGDILAGLEDAIVLGVDAINMSLGSSCGFSREVDDIYKNQLYDRIEEAGISLIVAASNDYSSAYGGAEGNTNKTGNPDSATVGSPSTSSAALSVASISGVKDKYMLANGNREVFFHESANMAAKDYDFFAMLGVTEGNPKSYEYVTIPGFGLAINYAGMDMKGKIALVRRGDITFEEKVQFAHEAGAAGVIIYNNVFGEIVMTVGNDLKIPAISIGKDDGEAMAAQESGTLFFDVNNQAGPFMSDFSSWGPTPDLKLKPEITAHGGNILSSVPGGGYEKLSGTSMAAPNMCGITVLIRQYVKEKYPTLTPAEVRDMVNRLCMSTATLALDRKGNPYSPRKQGAGIADILRATTTPAYLWVEGLGTTKLELGDDPQRTGEYKMSIKLSNLSDAALSYRLGNITMTESVSTSDPEYVAEMAYLLNNSAEYSAENATLVDGVLTVQPNQTAVVTVTLKLSAADKSYLNSNFKNGMYVEGFLTFDNTADDGIDLNAPFLAFYGDWAEAPIFDKDYYEVETEAHNNAIDDDDKIKADYYATTPMGKYYYDYAIPLGSYVYKINEEEYSPIPSTAEHAAMSYYANCINGIYAVYTGLLRGAKEMSIRIVNTATGEVVWEKTEHNCYKSHFSGAARPYFSNLDLNMANYETGEVFGDNNAHYEVIMSAQLDWKKDSNRNSSDTYSFSFYIDYEAPTITDAEFRTEYDKSKKENRYYVDLTVYDNHYAMSVRPIIMYEYEKEDGTMGKTYSSLGEYPIPVYQQTRGSSSKVTVEITDYIDLIKESGMREGITFYVDDYALNGNICYIPFPETESSDLAFENRKMDMKINETVDLTESLVHTNGSEDEVVRDYLKTLTWTTSDPTVVAVHDGKIEALQSGVATISVTGDTWVSRTGRKIIRTIDVTVGSESVENPDSRLTTQIEKLAFTYYDTLFAFNGDIDRSEIGETGSINYFGGNYNISFYPSEKVQLHYELRPWNMDPSRYELSWSSSNPKVATVDEKGVVTAEEKGRCSITLRITIDGKTSILAARCSIEVKSEFIIENRQLVAYKGKGGDVVIPDDEGIMTIGSFAFCHYKLDNEKDVPKDEDGTYDFDLKKEPLGNNSVTSVVIPDGVETIEKYAFYNCKLLKKVVLPESCKTIGAYAFCNNKVLEDINFNRVKVINDYAFSECEKLTNVDLSRVNSIGVNAFAGCIGLTEISLNDLRRTGAGAFKNCTNLKTVVLGERGRLSENAFENTAIENIVIFSDTIPDAAFKDCKSLKTVEIKNDLTYLGMEAFSGCTALESVVFRGGCEQIAASAFVNCTALKNFTLPDCDVVLGDDAFENSGLTDLTFGKNTVLTEIGNGVFWGVNGLNVNVDLSDHYTLTDGVVYSKDGSQLVLATSDADLGNFMVPASVKEICSGAFSFNQSLISVDFVSGFQLERIGYGAFSCCSKLERVNLPASEISIGAFAFYQTLSLKDFDFECVTSIGDFAFSSSAITSAKLTRDNVEIGIGAFLGCSGLTEVTVSAGAKIGEYAFRQSGVTTVAMSGDGVTVNEGAFYYCTKLRSIDLTHVAGKLGDAAFYMCSSLTSVDMPNVTELGVGCFADCYQLSNVKADKLEIIGSKAFSAVAEDAQSGAVFTTVSFPSLKKIGAEAFLGCIYLEQIDLTGVTEIESGAFGVCASLKKVILSDSLTVLNDSVFYGCSSLEEIDLQYIVEFGSMALFGARLTSLNLLNAEKIGDGAFIEDPEQDAHFLTSVNAPKLISVGSQAFAYCQKLKSFSAPMLEEIGMAAFAYTAFEEFEITPNLKTVENSPFFGAENLKAFYMMQNGSKTYSGKYQNVMIDNGVLYTSVKNGYVLSVYPVAKTDAELTVADGTVRIEFRAAYGNENLEKVTLPESLRYIGDFAFSGCSKLKTVVFRSYYAPVLEGTLTGDVEIKPDTIEDYPGFDSFYRYDYYYRAEDQVGTPRYYHNFVGLVTSKDAADLVCVLPDQCEGYDTTLYRAYFTPAEETSGETVGKYALAFIDAVRKLPEVADRFDKALVDAAVTAYNALEGHSEERKFVSDELLDLYKKACREYHVSVAENMIAHLFDMDNSEYFYNLVKDANLYFNGLTDEERALVSNTERLTQRTSELSAAMGKELNFELSYADYFKSPENPPVIDPPAGDDNPEQPAPNKGMAPWVIVLIVTGSVLVVAAAAVAVMLILRKKKSSETTEQK